MSEDDKMDMLDTRLQAVDLANRLLGLVNKSVDLQRRTLLSLVLLAAEDRENFNVSLKDVVDNMRETVQDSRDLFDNIKQETSSVRHELEAIKQKRGNA